MFQSGAMPGLKSYYGYHVLARANQPLFQQSSWGY